jgi:eukaryotic-like serine/threonine-protein kinase
MLHAGRLGRYELLGHLASGGMADVYLARLSGAHGFARHVVLKTVLPEQTDDPAFASMFLDEARLIAMLHHHHIAQVYDFGIAEDGRYFLAMEYLHGETVRAVLDRAQLLGYRLPLDFALTVVTAAAAGLHHAHEARGLSGRPLGIVHRDVTPANLIAGYDGAVKLIDFGIAKAAARSTTTRTGVVKGKPSYMSPEQARGAPVDRRSDVFTLGIVLYELTTQTHAFGAPDDHEASTRILSGELVPPSHRVPGYLPELDEVVLTALGHEADDRYPDAGAMRRALEALARRRRIELGETAVSRVLGELFGTRPEPWLRQPLLGRGSDSHPALDEEAGTDSTTLQYVSIDPEPPPEPPPPMPPALTPAPAPLPTRRIRRGRRVAIGLVASLVTALVAIVMVVTTERVRVSDAPHYGALHRSEVAPAPPPPPKRVERPAPKKPPPRVTPRGTAASITLRVTTDPSNATVVLDGERLGRSPIEMRFERSDEKVVLKVRKRGYRTKKQKVVLDGDVTWDIQLSRRR